MCSGNGEISNSGHHAENRIAGTGVGMGEDGGGDGGTGMEAWLGSWVAWLMGVCFVGKK